MQFRAMDGAVRQTNSCHTLLFAPASFAVPLAPALDFANTRIDCDGLDRMDFANLDQDAQPDQHREPLQDDRSAA